MDTRQHVQCVPGPGLRGRRHIGQRGRGILSGTSAHGPPEDPRTRHTGVRRRGRLRHPVRSPPEGGHRQGPSVHGISGEPPHPRPHQLLVPFGTHRQRVRAGTFGPDI